MAGINQISNTLKGLVKDPALIAAKVVGSATAASIIYDAHVIGKEDSESKESINSGDRFFGDYKQFMTSDSESATVGILKKMRLDSKPYSLYRLIDRVTGYLEGFGKTLGKNLPYIALSALALKFNRIGKLSAFALALHWGRILLTDVLHIGAPKEKV